MHLHLSIYFGYCRCLLECSYLYIYFGCVWHLECSYGGGVRTIPECVIKPVVSLAVSMQVRALQPQPPFWEAALYSLSGMLNKALLFQKKKGGGVTALHLTNYITINLPYSFRRLYEHV